MSDFDVAFDWMMDNEDSTRACVPVHDPIPLKDGKAMAISGINSYFYPLDYENILGIVPANRLSAVRGFYHRVFWNQWFAQLASDEVAKRVFDASVNMGPGTAVKLLQEAVNAEPSIIDKTVPIAVDGVWVPLTVDAANSCGTWSYCQVCCVRTGRIAR